MTEDEFPPARWLRDRIIQGGPEWVGDLVTCPWCASVYVAAGVVALTDLFVSVPVPLLTFGAVAALSPLLAVIEQRLDRVDHEPDEPEPEDESEMATMVTLERQVGTNGTGGY